MWQITSHHDLNTTDISTHTSRVGCDLLLLPLNQHTFISTHTSRVGCDRFLVLELQMHQISTHTSRVGCDQTIANQAQQTLNFYSHIPCGMWRLFVLMYYQNSQFLLTHPVWDVTSLTGFSFNPKAISTHTSRVGCDHLFVSKPLFINISTHTSRVGCDNVVLPISCILQYFYSHIPCGMWPFAAVNAVVLLSFLLTHPVWDVTYLVPHLVYTD